MGRKATHRLTPSQLPLTASPLSTPTTRSSSANSTASATPVTLARRQQSEKKDTAPARKASLGELAGGTAAECAAICCCFPCGVAGLLFCAVVKLPTGLCRKAIRRRKRKTAIARKKKTGIADGPRVGHKTVDDVDEWFGGRFRETEEDEWIFTMSGAQSPEVAAMEKEMWASFYQTGFWRSPSQREDR